MQFNDVCVESFGYTIPDEIWTSAEIENRLTPLYERLKLPSGRLELMTGIRERRFWPPDVSPSQLSIQSCKNALDAANFPPEEIGCLIHGSVCRDHLEPATACSVHFNVGLPEACMVFDISNACLGILTGMIQAANMIQLGQIRAALIVGSEGGRQLVEHTIETLNHDLSLTRKTVKDAFASLTIGSASCAVLMTHRSISQTGNILRSAAVRAETRYHDLCQSQQDQAGPNMQPLMRTDSETLMLKGVETGQKTMATLLANGGLSITDFDRTVCHQVGAAHRKLMLDSLQIDPEIDFPTFSWLGNTGAAAAPISMAIACEKGFIQAGQRVGVLGIGSGINCQMLEIVWKKSQVQGCTWPL